MIKVEIPERIMQVLRQVKGFNDNDTSCDKDILNMSKREFLNKCLECKGIFGYTTEIIDMIYYAFGIDLENDNEPITRIKGNDSDRCACITCFHNCGTFCDFTNYCQKVFMESDEETKKRLAGGAN